MVHTENVVLARSNARDYTAYLARPEAKAGPGILILTEMWGTTPSRMELAEEYARKGWCALVPTIFWRSENNGIYQDEGPERALAAERMRVHDFDLARTDLVTAANWLRASGFCSGKIAALGFCIGGRLAFLAAAEGAADGAVAMYGGGIGEHLADVPRIACPLQLHYGLADPHIPVTEIDAVGRAAEGSSNIELYRYPGIGHGFMNPSRATYDAGVVALANERIDALMARVSAP